MEVWTTFLASWIMPLIFVVSGASLYYAAAKGGPLRFIKDKVLRLLVPLVVGVFTHVALGVYLERITHHQFRGSFFQFYPHYFEGVYGATGNFAWMGLHLWYLLMLFIYSLALLPLFYLLLGTARGLLRRIAAFFSLPGIVYVLALPVIWLMIRISPNSDIGGRHWGGWNMFAYIPLFLYGFMISASEPLQQAIRRGRWVSLVLAVLVCGGMFVAGMRYPHPFFRSTGYNLVNGLFAANAWMWTLVGLGFSQQHLTRRTNFLAYANEAVLPFYILHQTVLLGVGYYVTRWELPAPVKFILISLSSFILIMVLYEFIIRRVNVLRFLFGMKARRPAVVRREAEQLQPVMHMNIPGSL